MTGKSEPLPMLELDEIESWLRRTQVAASALGRHVCDDQSLISRWRNGQSVSEAKIRLISNFIYDNPKGIPGYSPRKNTAPQRATSWNRPRYKDSSKNDEDQKVPVPSLEELNGKHRDWVKQEAFRRGIPLVTLLVELVEMGICCYVEAAYEEHHTHTGETNDTGC